MLPACTASSPAWKTFDLVREQEGLPLTACSNVLLWHKTCVCTIRGQLSYHDVASMISHSLNSLLLAVEDMVTIGNRLLRSAAPEQRKFGFHYPPFNSVMHLHLHCFKLPHKWWLQHKYMEKDNAWAGYMTAEQVLERLRAQMKQASREQS